MGIASNRHSTDSEYHTYNMDDKGFTTGVLGRTRRVLGRHQWEKNVGQARQDGHLEWMSLLTATWADGSALLPGVIFTSKNFIIQAYQVTDVEPGKHLIYMAPSSTGWTNNDLGLA